MPNLFSDLPVEILACVPHRRRIDAHRDPRGAAGLDREPRQQFELGLGFDVDAQDVRSQRRAQLGFGLADAGEQDFFRRNAGSQRPLQLAAGTTSAPAPSFASVRSTDWLEFAFMA